MLTTKQIFALGSIQNQKEANTTFVRVVTKVNICGLPLGTPFIAPTGILQEAARCISNYDPILLILNPCSIGGEYELNTLAEAAYSQLSVVSAPTFLDMHLIIDANNVEDFTNAFNHALAGGAATVFCKDPAIAKRVLSQTLPDIYKKYAHVGTFRSGYTPPKEKTALMVQFFHPNHCCAIYYPDKVDGVIMSISAVMIENSIAHEQIARPIFVNLFVSNFLDNILTLDGSKIASAASIDSNYFKVVEGCYTSMIQETKQVKKQTPASVQGAPGSRQSSRPSTKPIKTQTRIEINTDDWAPTHEQSLTAPIAASAETKKDRAAWYKGWDEAIAPMVGRMAESNTANMVGRMAESNTANTWGKIAELQTGSNPEVAEAKPKPQIKNANTESNRYYFDVAANDMYVPRPEEGPPQDLHDVVLNNDAEVENSTKSVGGIAPPNNISGLVTILESEARMATVLHDMENTVKQLYVETNPKPKNKTKTSRLREGYGGGSSEQKTADTTGESEDSTW